MSSTRGQRVALYRSAQRRYRPDQRKFEQLVRGALEELPDEFRSRLENVAIVVEEWPADERAWSDEDGEPLLGLYEGTAYHRRGTDYHLVPPDRITIYRGPILALCGTRAEVEREVRDTLIHEVGHYFGLDEEELP